MLKSGIHSANIGPGDTKPHPFDSARVFEQDGCFKLLLVLYFAIFKLRLIFESSPLFSNLSCPPRFTKNASCL